jgi:imidazoleglycerol phosphate synthase glutamine amidotransferase subunit HisH
MGWNTVKGTFASVQATKAYSEAKVYLHSFLTSALEWDVCSSSCYGRFPPEKNVPGTQ